MTQATATPQTAAQKKTPYRVQVHASTSPVLPAITSGSGSQDLHRIPRRR